MDPVWYLEHNITNPPPLEALPLWPYQVLLVSLYSTTAFISLGFNLITVVVLIKGDRMSSELWKFLINLSISDILMAIFSIPFTYTGFMLGRWVFHPFLCPIVHFMQLCSVFVSVWTLTAIGFDRYLKQIVTKNRIIFQCRGLLIQLDKTENCPISPKFS